MRKYIPMLCLSLACLSVIVAWSAGGSRAEAQQDTLRTQSPFLAVEPPLRVALLIPGKTRFWKMVADYALAAAEDLDMRLRVIPTGSNPGLFLRRLEDACRTGLDGVIMAAPSARGEDALRIVERNEVPCLIINADVRGIHYYPRTKYDQWLGVMSAGNEEAGSLLLRTLSDSAYDAGIANLNILAIGGDPDVPASGDRMKGFENALMRQAFIRKFETASAGPDPQQAGALFWQHFQKDPEINLVWCATDAMALAVAAEAAGKVSTTGLVIGGIGWDRGALRAVLDGRLQASVGGQVFEGAWAVILLCDYLHGLDFASEGVSYAAPLFAADKANAKLFNYLQGISPDAIDFRRFSKFFNPGRRSYGFDLLELAAPTQNPAPAQ